MDEKLKSRTRADAAEASAEAVEARRKAGARRTAWVIAAIAAAFFIASLLQGHFAHIAHW